MDRGDPLPADEAATRLSLLRMPDLIEHAPIRVGRMLYFADDVTADWLLTQVAAGTVRSTVAPTSTVDGDG